MADRTCSIDGCMRKVRARGWCGAHYERWRTHGSTDLIAPRSIEDSFWARVEKSEGCWDWIGHVAPSGYGYTGGVGRGGESLAHRLAYTLFVGSIPDGLQIDHMCHRRHCVNPDHLRLATIKQNSENRSGAVPGSKSGVRGVFWDKQRGKWKTLVVHHGRQYHAGSYATIEAAEAAVIAKRNELFTHNLRDRVAS